MSPTCAIEEYAIKRFASLMVNAIIDAYTTPMIPRINAIPPYSCTASSVSGSNQRNSPNNPIFNMMPDSNMVPAAGAWVYVSGCQVCSGNSGILIAKAMKNAQNTQVCASELSDKVVSVCHDMSRAPVC